MNTCSNCRPGFRMTGANSLLQPSQLARPDWHAHAPHARVPHVRTHAPGEVNVHVPLPPVRGVAWVRGGSVLAACVRSVTRSVIVTGSVAGSWQARARVLVKGKQARHKPPSMPTPQEWPAQQTAATPHPHGPSPTPQPHAPAPSIQATHPSERPNMQHLPRPQPCPSDT